MLDVLQWPLSQDVPIVQHIRQQQLATPLHRVGKLEDTRTHADYP